MKKSFLSLVAVAALLVSCSKDNPDKSADTRFGNIETMEDLKVPSSFDWRTAKNVVADVTVKSPMGTPMKGVRVDVYSDVPTSGGELISSGFTDASGRMVQELKLDAYLDEVYMIAHAGGIDNMRMIPLGGDNLNVTFGGNFITRTYKKGAAGSPFHIFDNVYGLNTWNANGSSNGLQPNRHDMDSIIDCANKIMAALPEYQSVPCDPAREHLVHEGVQTELVTTGQSDVYVTFLDEGATIQNTLGFYYYHPDSISGPWAKPGIPEAIDSIFVIFPRVDEPSGGTQTGDRIYLGNFPEGTHISWVLLQGAWRNGGVQAGWNEFYSNDILNADQGNNCFGADFDRHVVSIKKTMYINPQVGSGYDSVIVFGFEDLKFPNSDFDFNDAVWYVDGDSISCKKVPRLIASGDRDQDGIDDTWDDYPDNPYRACDLRYQGSLAFEDLWPTKGDYDMNDHVIYYDVIQTINGNMEVIEIDGGWTFKANGAGYDNGFGFKLGTADKATVASVSGYQHFGAPVLEGNGLEASPTNEALVLAWDRAKDLIPGNPVFFNTQGAPRPDIPVDLQVLFDSTGTLPSMMTVGVAPYDAYIISNQDRGREIHLVDMAPTDKAIASGANAYLGTQDDASDGVSNFYHTAQNLPWALDIKYHAWEWPKERVQIIDAYSDFAAWAMSGGMSFPGWYLSPDATKVYP